jgi:hypothetical protein
MKFEEYKVVEEKIKFIITRYMQGLALYLALGGFALKEIVAIPTSGIAVGLAGLVTCLNILTYIAAGNFRKMADHAIDKQQEIALELDMQAPYPLVWGYYAGVVCMVLTQLAIIGLALFRLGLI